MTNSIFVIDPDVGDLPSALVRGNLLKAVYNAHIADAVSHPVVDGTNVVAVADATNQTTLNDLLNDIKSKANAHRVQATVHVVDDTTNVIAAADAADLATSLTLLNQEVSMYNRHLIDTASHTVADRLNPLRNDQVILPADPDRGVGWLHSRLGSSPVYIAYDQMAEAPGNGDGSGWQVIADGKMTDLDKLRQGPWTATCETGNTAVIVVIDAVK